jgi:nucleotide-binding universal stress UspA family protein
MTVMTERSAVAGGKTIGQISRVIVGIDDSSAGLAALATATDLARSYGARLVAVRSWALGLPRHGGRRLRHLSHPHVVLSFAGAGQRAAATVLIGNAFMAAVGQMPKDITVTLETPESDPAVALVGLGSQPGDVIVVGTGGGDLMRRLVHGSVSNYCTRHAGCPVLVVPGTD